MSDVSTFTRNPNGSPADDVAPARRQAAGAIWPPIREDPPAPRPRGAGADARRVVEFLLENRGEWYRIGEFRTAQPPKGYYAQAGIEVIHRPIGDGLYARWARA